MNDAQAVETIRKAIRKRDLPAFQAMLEQRPDLWMSGKKLFHASRRSTRAVTLLMKLTTSEFLEGLRCYLGQCWNGISAEDVGMSTQWSMIYGTSKPIVRTFLEAAIAQKPYFIDCRQIFYCGMHQRIYDLAEVAVQLPGFNVSVRTTHQNRGVVWDLPIHEAVTHHQVAVIERLMEKGSHVDALSFGHISPMMIACHLIYPNIVVQLLRHGANPNYPPVTTYASRVSLRKLTKRLSADRGIAANAEAPRPTGANRASSLSDKADYILRILIEAGMRSSTKRFIQHSTVKRHLSPAMTQRLKNLSTEVRSLKTLALVKARDYIRFRCKGVRFVDAVNELDIPDTVKKQMTFRILP